MILKDRIELLLQLKDKLVRGNVLKKTLMKTYSENKWFTESFVQEMFAAVVNNYLDENKLAKYIGKYNIKDNLKVRIGIIMAGNIPLVGLHDFISVFLSGKYALVKLSSKDKVLWQFLFEEMRKINPAVDEYFEVVESLGEMDGIIATGSNNTNRYFEAYFGKYPNILRKNRTSVAVLNGKETKEELAALGNDIFQYFGLGCRNVSKIFLPKDYDVKSLLNHWKDYIHFVNHDKYKNNFDYNLAVLMMKQVAFIQNDFVLLVEEEHLFSPISVVFYEYYEDKEKLNDTLNLRSNDLQCIVGNENFGAKTVDFGQSQNPELWDFADGEDTMAFLTSF